MECFQILILDIKAFHLLKYCVAVFFYAALLEVICREHHCIGSKPMNITKQ